MRRRCYDVFFEPSIACFVEHARCNMFSHVFFLFLFSSTDPYTLGGSHRRSCHRRWAIKLVCDEKASRSRPIFLQRMSAYGTGLMGTY